MNIFERTERVLGIDAMSKLKAKKVIVFGCGGVGGYVVEGFVRCGIENIAVVDFDTVAESNLNRQIIATTNTINQKKVEAIKQRILCINPNCNVKTFDQKLTAENIEQFDLANYDFVIDAIDMVPSKISLIKYCNEHNINLICSMGTGNRSAIPHFEIADISKTENDGLSKVVRQELRKLGINHQIVCFSKQDALKLTNPVGSVVYFPAICGMTIVSYVINKLI